MGPWSIFLAGFSGAVGVIIGLFVSAAAREELQGYRRAFRVFRDYLFLIAAGLFLFQAGILVLLVGVFLLSVVLKEFSKEEVSKVIIVLHVMLLIMTAYTPLFPIMASVLLIVGVMEAGWWAAHNEKLLAKGVFRKEVWRLLVHEHVLYLVLPLANSIFML